MTASEGKRTLFLLASLLCARTHLKKKSTLANGLRYPLVGGTRQRRFAGTSFKPHKVLENAATPTSRVHAVLARSPKMAESVTALSPWKPIHSEYEPKNHTNGREASDRDCEPIDPTKVVV